LPYEITRIKQSAIVLSNPDTEGYLTMADAFALEMNADLVMLSACNTGRGEKIRGEGIRGLTRAFMYTAHGHNLNFLCRVGKVFFLPTSLIRKVFQAKVSRSETFA
jgi:hypothetical protein